MYISGNPPCASNADEIGSPVLTRAATFCSCPAKFAFLCDFANISSDPKIGNPARISVRNCWLKIRKVSSFVFRAPPVSPRGFTE